MFIAMNRFQVVRGKEDEFETVWRTRESYLESVPGFVEFHLLKGPESEDHTLYASHSVWQSRSAFEDWTRSEAFRAAHGRAGNADAILQLADAGDVHGTSLRGSFRVPAGPRQAATITTTVAPSVIQDTRSHHPSPTSAAAGRLPAARP